MQLEKRTKKDAGAAPDAELIVVKLRRIHDFFYNYYVFPKSQENAFSSADVMLAIEYMISKASKLRMPLAICISLGTNMAGSDGSSSLEEYISRVSRDNWSMYLCCRSEMRVMLDIMQVV